MRAYHVDNGEDTSSVSEADNGGAKLLGKGDANHAEDDVGGKVTQQEDELEASGQRADIDGGAQLELAVVPLPEHGRVQEVALEEGEPGAGHGEVALLLVVEADHGADLGVHVVI